MIMLLLLPVLGLLESVLFPLFVSASPLTIPTSNQISMLLYMLLSLPRMILLFHGCQIPTHPSKPS